MTTTTSEQLLTPKQVAELLQIHVGTLEAWRGRLEGPKWLKLGAGSRAPVRYKQADVDQYLRDAVTVK